MKRVGAEIERVLSRSLTAFVVGFGVCELIHASLGWSLVDCFVWGDNGGLDMRIMKAEVKILKSEMAYLKSKCLGR